MKVQNKARCVAVVLVMAALVMIPLAGITQAQGAAPPPPGAAPTLPPDTRTLPPGTGYRHPAMDLRGATVQSWKGPQMVMPDQFDWRTTPGILGLVENQGACGSCYAFGSGHGFESRMNVMSGASTASDLSEEYSKECNWRELNSYTSGGFPWGSCDGGNYMMLASLWAQTGHMLETDTGYSPADSACPSGHPFQQTLLDWWIISDWQTQASVAVLQNYIQTYGPVTTSIYAGDGDAWDTEFGNYNGLYTLDYAYTGDTNHVVLLVGWSNNLPPVQGSMALASGWIVKNSWGTTWGDNGYFYITYGSAAIGKDSSIMGDYQDYDPNGQIYFYDEDLGLEYFLGFDDGNDCAIAEFTPTANGYATRIETWTNRTNTTLDVYLYDTFAGAGANDPGTLLSQRLNQTYVEAGYHSVQIPPVAVTSGNNVYAVVCYDNGGVYNYPIPTDPNGTVQASRTWISDNGPTGGTWWDTSSIAGATACNAAVRLRTSSQPTAVEVSGFGAGTGSWVLVLVVLGGVGVLAGAVVVARRRRS